ncbi:MAG: hypothetical protein LQ338_006912 [Usnochroma carphineum]|nr:MAG: hypothetical protein LQ338_006912 [Usnochroma carphineum]
MSHTIFVQNLSDHDQEFEVHSWNSERNIVVGAGQIVGIEAHDGTTGAIIALHEGIEGEQAEIQKNASDGNDVIDISYDVGAGGNMTVQQVDNPATLKGDPSFMQHLDDAYQSADEDTKQSLEPCVHLDDNGTVVRIDSINAFPQLKALVSSFADNYSDQSSVPEGSTDIQVTYNDGDATPPNPIVTVKANDSTFVTLPGSFKGRVQRGTQLPATWVEFQISADNDGAAHGDISLEQGCDGAAKISATDGSGRSNGFTDDIVSGAPGAAFQNKPDGTRALATTMGNWISGPNQAAIDWENQKVGQRKAYIQGGTGTDDVASSNKCLSVDFY